MKFNSLTGQVRVIVSAAIVAASLQGMTFQPATAQTTDAKAICTLPNAAAKMVEAYPVDYSPLARAEGATGSATVSVTLTPSGEIADITIAKSSGSKVLDDASIAAVLKSRFAPELADCASVGGTYLVDVNWE